MHENCTGKGMHDYALISGWLYIYVYVAICMYRYRYLCWDSSKNIDIDISKRERRDHDSRFACVFRPAGSRSVKWDTWRASPRHNQCTAAGKNVCNFITTFFTWEADWNFELVQMVFGTLGALSFIFTMENCCLGQVHFWPCSNNVRHAWCAPSVFLHVGTFFVGAGGT